jgi:dihydropteroate synthase
MNTSAASKINQVVHLLNGRAPVIMGILNVTPDSFSDGGEFDQIDAAVKHALEMRTEGADIIDVGGESTRPGAEPVNEKQEIQRVVPVIEAIRAKSDVLISIDTSKPAVMKAAVQSGAGLVNDVNALGADGAVECCAELNVPVCLMHMKGEPRTMQQNPEYEDVVGEVQAFLQERARVCIEAGIPKDHIMIDPGFGFGKTLDQNVALFKHLDAICELDFPVLVGISRKSMLGQILDRTVDERLIGSVAAAVVAYNKGARLFRVHDVAATRDALRICTVVDRTT